MKVQSIETLQFCFLHQYHVARELRILISFDVECNTIAPRFSNEIFCVLL